MSAHRAGDAPLRILFVLEHPGHLRKFEAGVRELAARGHQVCLAVPPDAADRRSMVVADRLASEFPGVRVRTDAPEHSIRWPYAPLARGCRATVNYVRFLDRRHDCHAKTRQRAARNTLAPIVWLLDRRRLSRGSTREAIRGLAASIERSMPVHPSVSSFLRDERPDVLLVTPLVTFDSGLVDFVRAAAHRQIPTCLGVASWDNLTTKGVLHAFPDRMIVWNEGQAREAWEELRYPPLRVFVAGAHAFDDWFRMQPGPRAAFCARVGLDPNREYLLYVGSSRFIAPDETPFVDAWLDRLRSSADPRIRQLSVLIRPHPQNAGVWSAWRTAHEGVVVSPRGGEVPETPDTKADYFDALYHSRAVVGLNTTALVEAGIVGRPVLTVVTGDYGQDTSPHFHHLVDAGLVKTCSGFDEHLRQLADTLAEGAPDNATFIDRFVRPYGREWDAAPLFAAAVEDTAAEGSMHTGTRSLRLRRWLVLPMALAAAASSALYDAARTVWRGRGKRPRVAAPAGGGR